MRPKPRLPGVERQVQADSQVFRCTYKRPFSERKRTVLEPARLPDDKAPAILKHIREGYGTRATGRLVEVVRTVGFGTMVLLNLLLKRSTASTTINSSFMERNNGADRRQNSRKRRKTYGFSKEPAMHRAVSFFIGDSDNFCWPVRTLRARGPDGFTAGPDDGDGRQAE